MSNASEIPPPATIMRRMGGNVDSPRITLSRAAAEPMLRVRVEASRGTLIVQLTPDDAPDTTVQWMQNGVPLAGQTGPILHLAGLTPDETDLYYATIRSSAGEVRSQSFLLVVVTGHPLLNCSMRGRVAPDQPLTAGFVVGRVTGPVANKRYLVRAIGRSLARFGVPDAVAHPTVQVLRGTAPWTGLLPVGAADDEALESQQRVGAFALDPAAPEFVAMGRLPPGPYTLVVRGGAGESGEVLVEVYELAD